MEIAMANVSAKVTEINLKLKPQELLILIDRRFSRHLPIQPDYRGRQVDAIEHEKVIVNWKESVGKDEVYLIKQEL